MKLQALFAALAPAASTAFAAPAKHTFAIGTNDFLLDGQRFQIRCGVEKCMNLRVYRMAVGASGPNPLDFERVGNCGEFATIRIQANKSQLVLIPSNSTGLESRAVTVSHVCSHEQAQVSHNPDFNGLEFETFRNQADGPPCF